MLDVNSFKNLPIARYRQLPGAIGWFAKHLETGHQIAIGHEKDLTLGVDGTFYLSEVIDLSCRKDGQKYRLMANNLEVGIRPSTHPEDQHCVMNDLSKDYKWVNFSIITFNVMRLQNGHVRILALLKPKELVPVGGTT